jgi:beta-glucanase (GH16 family)
MNFTLKFQLMKKITIGLLMLLLFAITISCDNDTASNESEEVTTVYEGWTLEWSDEFNATEINTNNWTYELGDGTDYGLPVGWGNNEKQIYTQRSENVSIVEDGEVSALAITALEDATGGYTSAKLTTQNLFSARFGRVEVRAKMPKGQGLLPAIWMLGDNKDQISWPGCGEIDIAEVVGNEPSKFYSTLHYTSAENKHAEKQGSTVLPDGDFSDAYHIFTLDWTPESVTFSLDGQKRYMFLIENDMKEFLRSAYLILNVAVGGNWPGETDETTLFPQTMYTDYIRVYSKDGFESPEAPALDIEEETVGQIIEVGIADNAIQDTFTNLGGLSVIAYGPGAPDISSSATAINGDKSLVYDFSGGDWGGAYLLLDTPTDISAFNQIKFSLNKPDTFVNAEIKLEAGATNALVFLKDYSGIELTNGFVEYTIPLADFVGLELSGLTVPFSIWNPQDANDAFVEVTVLIDNIYFAM